MKETEKIKSYVRSLVEQVVKEGLKNSVAEKECKITELEKDITNEFLQEAQDPASKK